MGELGEPRPGLDFRLRHQAVQQRPDGFGAEEHRLDHAAGVQQPVGEYMAAIGVGAELDFVHRQEFRVAVERHRLHRAGEPARVGRDDFLLAGDERNIADALARHHAVVILARQQAQRKTDDAGGMGQQALDGEMGFAGVGGPQDGLDMGGERDRAGHGEIVVCCGAECKRFRAVRETVR